MEPPVRRQREGPKRRFKDVVKNVLQMLQRTQTDGRGLLFAAAKRESGSERIVEHTSYFHIAEVI